MNIGKIIENKRDNKELSKEEIEYFINGYTEGTIKDYQAAALIMAIYINGMNDNEMTNLTIAMTNSGKQIDLSGINKIVVDKHSTGGVGDKVSLIVLPIISSLGVAVGKMSGRGLGFTGGTVDKLEAIPGYKTGIEMKEFISNVNEVGISIISQTLDVAPADKKIYALRDSISCVESIPLIASSIMSKKIASGAQKLVLDVTVGRGAFMKDLDEAIELATKMNTIGNKAGVETVSILTNMDEPLGHTIGNSLEVIEAVEFLKGNMPEDLKEVVLELGAYMMKLAGISENINENKEMMLENILNGKAYNKLIELVKNQSGDITFIEDTSKFRKAKIINSIISEKSGYLAKIDAKKIGEIACELGAGRVNKEDEINEAVGIVLNVKVRDKVEAGDIIGYIHSDISEKAQKADLDIKNSIVITEDINKVNKKEHILKIID